MEKEILRAEQGAEARLDLILNKYEKECANPLVSEITVEISDKLGQLSEEKQNLLLENLENFFKALSEYYDSYDNLKMASARQRMLHFDDIEDFQKSVTNADRRERALHNNFLDSINILSRTMKECDIDNSWRGNDAIFHLGGKNDSSDEIARDKLREWMLRIYNEL